MPAHSKFRGRNNSLLTQGLFFETALDKSTVLYTLKDWDHTVNGITYPSLYLLYMAENDPTEYKFAVKHLDCWEQWEVLTALSWFQEYAERWRKELSLRLKSESLARIIRESKTSSKEAIPAARYLLEEGWNKNTKGRPSKADIAREAKSIISSTSRINEDLQRIGLN